MYRNVRAALALSLPAGLIVLSAGGAVLGLRNASHDAPAARSADLAVSADRAVPAEPLASSPPAKSSPLTPLPWPEEALPLKPIADEPSTLAAREASDVNQRSKAASAQPPRLQISGAARCVESEPYFVAAQADDNGWQASATQYTSPPATATQYPATQNAAEPRFAERQYPSTDVPFSLQPPANVPAPSAPPPPQAVAPLPLASERPVDVRPPAPLDVAALAPVSQQAELRVDEAFRYARRGALYAARAELIQALRTISQAVDTLERSNRRSQALAAGFQAMKEAEDFFVGSDTLEHDLDVEGIVLAHRTPVLKGQSLEGVSSLAALQQYYAYAQQQFAIAAAGTPAGSKALYGLGKVHMTLGRESGNDRSHQTPKAMAFFQAAMQADERNYLAANELGVLLAEFGQLAEAKRVLVHSVSMHSHPEGWQNLAVVHMRLGEHELARKANYERELLLARSPEALRRDRPVTWVGPQEFNAAGGPDAMATAPAKPGPATRR